MHNVITDVNNNSNIEYVLKDSKIFLMLKTRNKVRVFHLTTTTKLSRVHGLILIYC